MSIGAPKKNSEFNAYKNTLCWHWLEAIPPTSGEIGGIIRLMRDNGKFLKHEFPHKRYLNNWIRTHCKLEHDVVWRNLALIWEDFVEYRAAVKANYSSEPVRWSPALKVYTAEAPQ